MIKAEIIERYIDTKSFGNGVKELVHETRYFSSMKTFFQWYSTFNKKLWKDNDEMVDLAEGIFVRSQEIDLDNTSRVIFSQTD